MSFQVITRGFTELEAAFTKTIITVDPVLGGSLRALAEPVKASAQQSASGWKSAGVGQARTASGIRIRRNKLNVRVEQGLSKTTGEHANYGGIQMRHFFTPALEAHKAAIEAGAEAVIGGLIAKEF